MKRSFTARKFGASLFILLFGLMIQSVFPQGLTTESPLPPPTGFVNDYAGVIDAVTKQKLENQIKEFKDKTNPSVELAVAVVKTTDGRDIFDYSLAVARGWKIGSKNQDNPSALLFVAIDDRKYFTQVSRDLEDELPDGLVGSLQRQYLVPEFKKGNYSKGISDTIDAYIRTVEARRSGEPVPATTPKGDIVDRAISKTPNWLCRGLCLIAVIIFFISIFSGGGKGGRGGRGGRGGGGSGGDIASGLLWAILAGAASSGSSSGSSSSGWGGGGSSDGGGWGGFGGGGDFGGGGAGGDW